MLLSDLAVKRPVFATVLSLVVVTLGIVGLSRLGVRELPDIDAPTVSIETRHLGAAAAGAETRVTQVTENAVSGIDGFRTISPQTRDERAWIDIEFVLAAEPGAARDGVRDRVQRVVG